MKKQWLLLIVSTTLTVVLALALLRWLARELLGVPRGLQLVAVSRELPPFLRHCLLEDDFASTEMLLQDPLTIMRGRPLWNDRGGLGPHDLLGFRNRSVPNVADLVAIADSRTYGINALLKDNWLWTGARGAVA